MHFLKGRNSFMEFNKIDSFYCFDAYEKSDGIRFNAFYCQPNRPVLYAVTFLRKF